MAKKEKQAVWLYPEVKELLTTHMAAANARKEGCSKAEAPHK